MKNKHKKATQTLTSERGKCENIKESKHNQNFKLRQGTKKYKILELFCQGKKLSCLDHYWTFDTCLHSTVDKLSKQHGLTIPRTRLKLPNRSGDLVSVSQYYFSDDDIAKIKPLLSEVGDE